MVEKNTNSQCTEESHHKEGVMAAVLISSVFSPAEVQVNIHYLTKCVCVCIARGGICLLYMEAWNHSKAALSLHY